MSRLALGSLVSLLACSGASGGGSGGPQGPIERPPEPKTEAVLVGPLCQGDHCQCKE